VEGIVRKRIRHVVDDDVVVIVSECGSCHRPQTYDHTASTTSSSSVCFVSCVVV
jgi:hypothetical protein